MKNHLAFVLPFCVCFSLLLGTLQTAHAGRVVDFTILQDGKTILRAYSGDDGRAGPNAVWRYLYTVALHPVDGFQFKPERPLRMVLRGNIRITCKYSGEVSITSLELVRDSVQSNQWRLAPQEVERTLKLKMRKRSNVKSPVSGASRHDSAASSTPQPAPLAPVRAGTQEEKFQAEWYYILLAGVAALLLRIRFRSTLRKLPWH